MSKAQVDKFKPPVWAVHLRRFLGRTCPDVGIVSIFLVLVAILTMIPIAGRGMGFWGWTSFIFSVLASMGIAYAIGGLLLRLFLASLIQYSLGGLLATILALGACVSAWVSSSLLINILGTVLLILAFTVALYFNAKNEARYDWSND